MVRAQKRTLGLNLHDFWFDRETRRMVCDKCGGVMGECPHKCTGKKLFGIPAHPDAYLPATAADYGGISRDWIPKRERDPFDEMESADV